MQEIDRNRILDKVVRPVKEREEAARSKAEAEQQRRERMLAIRREEADYFKTSGVAGVFQQGAEVLQEAYKDARVKLPDAEYDEFALQHSFDDTVGKQLEMELSWNRRDGGKHRDSYGSWIETFYRDTVGAMCVRDGADIIGVRLNGSDTVIETADADGLSAELARAILNPQIKTEEFNVSYD